MAEDFFIDVASSIPFGGPDSDDALSFKVYDPDRPVLGKRMEDHLRMAVMSNDAEPEQDSVDNLREAKGGVEYRSALNYLGARAEVVKTPLDEITADNNY